MSAEETAIADKSKLYRTSDIYFASFLCSLDMPLKTTEVEKTESGRKVVFVFQMTDIELQRMKASYFGGAGTVKARRFVDNIRSLKSMCFT
jgi:hypothetical protein